MTANQSDDTKWTAMPGSLMNSDGCSADYDCYYHGAVWFVSPERFLARGHAVRSDLFTSPRL